MTNSIAESLCAVDLRRVSFDRLHFGKIASLRGTFLVPKEVGVPMLVFPRIIVPSRARPESLAAQTLKVYDKPYITVY